MELLNRFFGGSNADSIISEIQERIDLPYQQYQSLEEAEMNDIVQLSMAFYTQGLAADEAGHPEVANRLYRRAFETFPFNIESLDNCALNLMLARKFSKALPLLEQSVAAEQDNPIAFRYLILCNREVGSNQQAVRLIKAYESRWPGDSPFVDLSKPPDDQLRPACSPFEPGQVWQYHTRESESNSRIWIRFLEEIAPGEYAVHISVTNMVIKARQKLVFVSHLPVALETLKQSVTQLTDERQTWETEDDQFGSGFRLWFDQFSEGKAGIFTIPMTKLLDIIEQSAPEI